MQLIYLIIFYFSKIFWKILGVFGTQLIKIDFLRRLFFYPVFNKEIQSDLELLALLGFKESADLKKLRKLVTAGSIDECIVEISDHMSLPVKVLLIDQSAANFKKVWNSSDAEIIFGENVGGAIAQVKIPNNLPSFGSSKLIGFPIEIRIDSSLKEKPDIFIYTIAHELSHVLLFSLNHKERKSERFTDLMAMAAGFYEVMFWGRKEVEQDLMLHSGHIQVRTNEKSFGYLTDDEFNYAYDKIKGNVDFFKRQKNKISKQIFMHKKELLKVQNIYLSHFLFLKQIELCSPNTISINDAQQIAQIYQNQHLASCKCLITDFSNLSKSFYEKSEFLLLSSKENIKVFSALENQLLKKFHEIKICSVKLEGEIKILKKYLKLRSTIGIQFGLYVQWLKGLLQILLK